MDFIDKLLNMGEANNAKNSLNLNQSPIKEDINLDFKLPEYEGTQQSELFQEYQ